jgi:hypothetical protein
MRDELLAIIILGDFILVGWVLWIVARRLEQKARLRAELHTKMVERFGTVQELSEFINTEGGRRFIESYSMRPASPLLRILRTVQAGVVCLILGVGMFVLAAVTGRSVALVPTVILTSLGLGLLASAGLAYRLSRAWGLTSKAAADAGRERLPQT